MDSKTGITQAPAGREPLSSRGGTGRENVSVAAAAAPFPLLPCPFCGGKAFIQNGVTVAPNGDPYSTAWCIDCGAMSRDEKDDQSAIAVWNHRAALASTIEACAKVADGAWRKMFPMPRSRTTAQVACNAAARAIRALAGKDAAGEKAGITQAERAQRTSEHPSTGMREALEEAEWLRSEVPNTDHPPYLRVRFAAIASKIYALSSTGDERRETIEECRVAVSLAAWKHIGDDAYSQGMDAGAVHQLNECLKAIRSLLHAAPDGGGEDSGA